MKKIYTRFFSLALALGMSAASWAIDKVDGIYQIGTVDDFKEFAVLVNNGTESKANAALIADIDLGAEQIHINNLYGTLDGQGHSITVNYVQNKGNYAEGSLIGDVKLGAVVCNLITRGEVESNDKFAAGICYRSWGYIHNCATFINIKSKGSGDMTHAGIAAAAYEGAIVNCLSAMKITGETTTNCAGIVGWCQNRFYLRNNLSIADMDGIKVTSDCGSLVRNPGNVQNNDETRGHYKQNFFKKAYGNTDHGQQVTEAQLKSGEVCYRLNAGMKTPQWFQKEGDAYPLPIQYEGATTVGASVAANCMVTDLAPEATFTFGGGQASTQHEMFHGRCKKCGFLPLEEMNFALSGKGIEIANRDQFMQYNWYRYLGSDDVSACLVADVDMGNYPYVTHPQDDGFNLWGEFDGQGHKLIINISDHSLEGIEGEWAYSAVADKSVDLAGFRAQPFKKGNNCCFQRMSVTGSRTGVPAIVHDLYVTGNIESQNKFAGSITGYMRESYTNGYRIYNVYSDVNININILAEWKNDCTAAGIIGSMQGENKMKNVVFAGTINANGANNCGGLIGWAGQKFGLQNCLMIGEMVNINGDNNVFARNPNNLQIGENVFYSTDGIKITAGVPNNVTKIEDASVLTSGALTYTLNNSRVENVAWTQTLGEGGDKCPIPLKTHGRVNHISSVGYATQFIPSADVVIPAGVEAYAVTVADSKITLNPITDKISKEDAVVLKGNEGYYSFAPTTDATKAENNDLKGAATDLTAEQMQAANVGCDKFYALRLNAALEPESVGFYWAEENGAAFALEAGKGYLALPVSAKAISGFRFSDGGTTGIETLKQQTFDGAIYNLQGQRVNANAKGIVIMNGKKVLVKK